MNRHIVFDLDGTLVDSRDHILSYNKDLFTALGKRFPIEEEELFYTLDKDALERRFFAKSEQDSLKAFRKNFPYIDRLNEIVAVGDAEQLLVQLKHSKSVNYRLAVLTNRGTSTPKLLEQLGWTEYFDIVISANMLEHPKPHPQGLQIIAENWEVQEKDLLFIGDSAVDYECAGQVGAQFIQITALADRIAKARSLKSLNDLKEYLDMENS